MICVGGQTRYADNFYDEAGLAVELDGRAAHPLEQRWADHHRDNAHASLGILTLRYNWSDVTSRACAVAAQVAEQLQLRGLEVRLRACGPGCFAEAGPGAQNSVTPTVLGDARRAAAPWCRIQPAWVGSHSSPEQLSSTKIDNLN